MPGERGHQKLTSEVEVKGADQAAKDFDKIGDAQKGVTDETKDAVKETTKAAEAQKELNAAESDYISLLTQIDPVLGRFADATLKGGKVLGEMANTEINLGDAVDTVTRAMAAQASTLKLLGAAGGVAVGFIALSKAIGAVRAESQKLREELRELKAQATTEEEERIAGAREVTRLARRRRERGFRPEEEVEAERLFGLVARGGGLDREQLALFQQNLAALVGLLTGPEIEALTRAGVQIELGMPAEWRERAARRELGRPEIQEAARREELRAEAARARSAAEAMKELRADDALEGLGHLNIFLEEVAKGLDPEAVRDLAKRALEIRGAWEEFQRTGDVTLFGGIKAFEGMTGLKGLAGGRDIRDFLEAARLQRAPWLGEFFGMGTAGGTPAQMQAAARLLELLERLNENLERGEARTINQFHHAKFIGPDATSQLKRTRNGETEAVRLAG